METGKNRRGLEAGFASWSASNSPPVLVVSDCCLHSPGSHREIIQGCHSVPEREEQSEKTAEMTTPREDTVRSNIVRPVS